MPKKTLIKEKSAEMTPAFSLRRRCPEGADEVWYAKRTLRRKPQKYRAFVSLTADASLREAHLISLLRRQLPL